MTIPATRPYPPLPTPREKLVNFAWSSLVLGIIGVAFSWIRPPSANNYRSAVTTTRLLV